MTTDASASGPPDLLAQVADVEASWRPLSDLERPQAVRLLERASALLRHLAPEVDARVASGALPAVIVAGGVADAVARRLANPDGVVSRAETTGPYVESVRYATASSDDGAGLTFPAAFLAMCRAPETSSAVGTIRVRRVYP